VFQDKRVWPFGHLGLREKMRAWPFLLTHAYSVPASAAEAVASAMLAMAVLVTSTAIAWREMSLDIENPP
jgi:hypothetical protein